MADSDPGVQVEIGRLEAERLDAVSRIAELEMAFASIVDASQDVALDDEHDPDGSTVAFERAQVAALLERARVRLSELDRAIVRFSSGRYGLCANCGEAIGSERLSALPETKNCIDCAV